MKRYPVTITNRLSFLADIVTITPYFKDFLSKSFGIEAVDAATINRTVFIFALIIFVTTLIWLYIDKKLSQAGTRKIACTLSAYKTYKIYNKSNKLLRNVHCKMYHEIVEFKQIIRKAREEKIKNEQNGHLEYKAFNNDVTKILDKFHSILKDIFKLDLSINLYIISKENGDNILTRWIFLRNEEEEALGEQREKERQYIIRNSDKKDLEGYASSAAYYSQQNHNGDYWTNSIFDYLMTSNHTYFMSNDLRLDEEKGRFYTTNEYYKDENKYNSLAAFAIIPPSNGYNVSQVTKGILTFDTTETKVFSEKECTMLMGLMAHYIFEILEFIKKTDYAEKTSTNTSK